MTQAQLLYGSSVYALPARTLVVLPAAWPQVRTEDKEQLQKLLAYYRVPMGQAWVIHRERVTAADLSVPGVSRAVLFGVDSDIPFATVTRAANLPVVNACALSELRGLDATRKAQLTEALKSLFS